jgi:hypothetical protein
MDTNVISNTIVFAVEIHSFGSETIEYANFEISKTDPKPISTIHDLCLKYQIIYFGYNQYCSIIKASYISEMKRHKIELEERELLFVHIGKTAGSFLQDLLTVQKIVFRSIHCLKVNKGMITRNERLLISIRDPLERLISAFNFCKIIDHPYKVELDELYQCFSDVTSFFEALVAIFSFNKRCFYDLDCETPCEKIAADYIRPGERGHIGRGYEWYLGDILEELSHLDVYIIRQEEVVEDYNGLRAWLGQDDVSLSQDAVITSSSSRYYYSYIMTPSFQRMHTVES